jgi:hypothetical protein
MYKMILLSLSPVQYEQVYWIFFCLFALFFQTSYFFSLKKCKLVHIEQVIGIAKSFKILTLASNRTEAKLVSDISFVVVQFKKNEIILGDMKL